MNKAVNTYWTDARLAAQRPTSRVLTLVSPVREISRGIPAPAVISRPDVRRHGVGVPPWVVFSMIILATFAACVTVTMRTHAGMLSAEHKYDQMSTDVERLRNENATLAREVERLRKDPRAIEAAARARLNMLRANEIVVPIE